MLCSSSKFISHKNRLTLLKSSELEINIGTIYQKETILKKPQLETLDKLPIWIESFQELKSLQEFHIWMELIFQELPLNGSGIRKLQSVLGDHFTMSSTCVITTDHTKEPHWESIHSQMFILNLDYLQILDFHKTLFNKNLFFF